MSDRYEQEGVNHEKPKISSGDSDVDGVDGVGDACGAGNVAGAGNVVGGVDKGCGGVGGKTMKEKLEMAVR